MTFHFPKLKQSTQATTAQLEAFDFGDVAVEMRRNSRARRIILRVDSARDRVELVLPDDVSESEGLAFLERKRKWLNARLAEMPERIAFVDGAEIPVRGEIHQIAHAPDAVPSARGVIWTEPSDGTDPPLIRVMGAREHLSRRLTDWFKQQARRELASTARACAEELGERVARVTVRDTRSRWGSCTSRGGLAFSWRLILAPTWVSHYVVCHEVAHLRHLDHSPAFWSLCADLVGSDEAVRRGRDWLKQNGRQLHRYG